LPSIATIVSVGLSFPAAGSPLWIAEMIAPVGMIVTFRPSARSATAAATCVDVFISDRSTVRCCEAETPVGMTSSAG
jgi:hypothetical protein